MASLEIASQIAGIFSAIATAAQLGISYHAALEKVDRKEIEQQAKLLASTYSDDELRSIHERIQSCRDRFIHEGDGGKRVQCMCSVLEDAIIGNGGTAPIPEWAKMFRQLCNGRSNPTTNSKMTCQ